jgi:protein-ribulosamine 3-kinase
VSLKDRTAHFTELLNETVIDMQEVQGGCSFPSFVLTTQTRQVFAKTHHEPSPVFECEALGLQELSKAGAKTPEIYFFDERNLFLEFLAPEKPSDLFWQELGRQLADVHKKQGPSFGFKMNNFIGRSKQINITSSSLSWGEFFWHNRLLVQLRELELRGLRTYSPDSLERMQSQCQRRLAHNPEPSPLHGDLWYGNIHCTKGQAPYLIDPAFYFGDREIDLAMTECFGGFDPLFYDSYNESYPLDPGYNDRKDIYNLYHMLNHERLFGSQYKPVVDRLIVKLQE